MPEDGPVGRILQDWLAARDEGRAIDPVEVVRANPAHRRQLERCFAAQARLQAAQPDRPGPGPGRALPTVEPERYADFRVLGVGGMGVVYRATDLRLNTHVALKALRAEGPDTTKENAPASPFQLAPPPSGTPAAQRFEAWRARFLQEVAITGSLAHPNVVPIFDVAQTPAGVPFYTMRYYGGLRTLATAIQDLRDEPPAARLILLEPYLRLCDTMHYAHARGVIHRDLKPENVLLGEFGEVIVVDWGLARLQGTPDRVGPAWKRRVWEHRRDGSAVTQPGALGTAGYMAPEACRGALAETDARTDVFSLGAVLFEILNGWTPHESAGGSSVAGDGAGAPVPWPAVFHPAVPPGLRRICARAMAPAREDRYAHAGELDEAVRAWQVRVAARDLVEERLTTVQEGLDVAAGLRGEERLVAIARVREHLAPAAGLWQPDARAQAYGLEVARLWKQGLKEHGRRRRYLALIVLVVATVVILLGAAMCYAFRRTRGSEGEVGRLLAPARHAAAGSAGPPAAG